MARTTRGPRLWADVEPAASRRLLIAALDAFAQKGYFATTTREIAEKAGMSPAAVYVHYKSKDEMLAEICHRGHATLLVELEQALEVSGSATERVQRFVSVFAGFHARQSKLGRVMQYELRGLTPEQFRKIAATRRRIEDLINDELQAGVASGEFAVDDVAATAVAILSLGIDVARWRGARAHRLSDRDLGQMYADLAARMIRA